MKQAPVHSPSARVQAAFQIWLANFVLAASIGSAYLAHVPETHGLRAWVFAVMALLSQVATLSLIPGLGFLLAARLLPTDPHREGEMQRRVRLLLESSAVTMPSLPALPPVEGSRTGFLLRNIGWLFQVLFASLQLLLRLVVLCVARCLGLARRLASVRSFGVLMAVTWIVLQVLWYTDTRIYNLFHYHFNAHVWNLMSTRGSEDAVHLGWQVWLAIGLGLIGGSSVQYMLWRRWLSRAEELRVEDRLPQRLLRPGLMWCVVLLGGIFVEKSIYAQADLENDKEITALGRLLPAYPMIPAQEIAREVLGFEELGLVSSAPPRVEIDLEVQLDYPHLEPELDPAGERPNIMMVVVDCWRADMLSEENTPWLSGFAEECVRFEDHWSGGNSTRFGIFSMLYGLHGTYWFPVLAEERPPVLLETLDELGYDIEAFAAADMHYPELRSTVWSGQLDSVHDEFSAETNWERDIQARDALYDWLDEREGEDEPFFGFYLVDSPHPTYGFPPDEAPFQPIAEEINYLAMSATGGPEPEVLEGVYNRYLNAVRHADELIRGLVEDLEQRGLLEDTLLVITGDHGEEFRENGFFGHTSNFTAEQCAVPLLLHGAGIEPGVVTRRTSHIDLPATLLEHMGADPSLRGAWTLGGNLFEEPADADERRRVVSAWKLIGLQTPEGHILRVPLRDAGSFRVEVYDERWQLEVDDEEILKRERGQLERLAEQCTRFLAPD